LFPTYIKRLGAQNFDESALRLTERTRDDWALIHQPVRHERLAAWRWDGVGSALHRHPLARDWALNEKRIGYGSGTDQNPMGARR
jgi:hypothetical protein